MILLSDNNQKLRRDFSLFKGTSCELEVIFFFGDESCRPYKLEENDSLVLTVIDYRNNDETVIQKTVLGDNFFSFMPSDTENLDVGFYRYNVKFLPANSQNEYQVIAPSIFHIEAGE